MKRCGFSLLEVLLVVVILGVIAALVMPRMSGSADTAKSRVCNHNCGQINGTVERYRVLTGSWPAADLSDIGADPAYFPEGLPTCPESGAAYRLDTTGGSYRVLGHTNGNHSP